MDDQRKDPAEAGRGISRTGSKTSPGGRGKELRFSRIYMLAAAIILAGAVFLFWSPGKNQPETIGERVSVVTADQGHGAGSMPSTPRSSDVAIEDEQQPLVPERLTARTQTDGSDPTGDVAAAAMTADQSKTKPAQTGSATTTPPPAAVAAIVSGPGPGSSSTSRPTTETLPPATKAATTGGSSEPRPTPEPAQEMIAPLADGPWSLQLGAFGKQENAQKVADELLAAGHPAKVHAANAASGKMLYKVRIGYFSSQADAAAYARQHKKLLGGGLPVHR